MPRRSRVASKPWESVLLATPRRSSVEPETGDDDRRRRRLGIRGAGLTAYDASYLWLAGSLGADLITLDKLLSGAGVADPG